MPLDGLAARSGSGATVIVAARAAATIKNRMILVLKLSDLRRIAVVVEANCHCPNMTSLLAQSLRKVFANTGANKRRRRELQSNHLTVPADQVVRWTKNRLRLCASADSFEFNDPTESVPGIGNDDTELRRLNRRERKLPPRLIIPSNAATTAGY